MSSLENVKQFSKENAADNLQWVKDNPSVATGLIWWLLGYAGLGKSLANQEEGSNETRAL